MRHALAGSMLAAALLAANPPPPPADAPPAEAAPAPNSAVVGGHHIQPRANAPAGAPDGAAINKRDAEDVDRLFQELMRQTAPDATRTNGSSAPQ